VNTSVKPNWSQKKSHDLSMPVTKSWGSAPTIVALGGGDLALSGICGGMVAFATPSQYQLGLLFEVL
jgi:hypothetical protein